MTEAASLEAELAIVRERGWASTTEEFEIGLNAVAAPVRDATGEVVAAVGVSGPSYRLTVESFPTWRSACSPAPPRSARGSGYFGAAPPLRPVTRLPGTAARPAELCSSVATADPTK